MAGKRSSPREMTQGLPILFLALQGIDTLARYAPHRI